MDDHGIHYANSALGATDSISDLKELEENEEHQSFNEIENDSVTSDQVFDKNWIIVFVSFMIQMIAEGVSFSFGLVLIEIVYYFKETHSKTALIGSLIISLPLLLGPLAAVFIDYFGCQKMIFVGSILSSTAFFISYFLDSVNKLIFAFALAGFGMAFMETASLVIIMNYFDEKRELATGLATSGTGFGTILFPPCIATLIYYYKWNTIFIFIGLTFVSISLISLLIPSTKTKKKKDKKIPRRLLNWKIFKYDHHLYRSQSNLEIRVTVDDTLQPSFSKYASHKEIEPKKVDSKDNTSNTPLTESTDFKIHAKKGVHDLNTYSSFIVCKGGVLKSKPCFLVETRSCPEMYVRSDSSIRKNLIEASIASVVTFFSNEIFKNKSYGIFCFANFLYYFALDTTYLTLPAFAIKRGISKDNASLLISLIGVFNTLGMIVLSLYVSNYRVSPSLIFAISSIFNGMIMVAIPWLNSFTALAVAVSLFGWLVSVEFVLSPLITIQFIDIDNFASAYGFILLFEGVAIFLGPPLAGLSYDYLKNYDVSFYTMGFCYALSSLLVFIIVILEKKQF